MSLSRVVLSIREAIDAMARMQPQAAFLIEPGNGNPRTIPGTTTPVNSSFQYASTSRSGEWRQGRFPDG